MEQAGNPNESVENKRKRLIFRSDHRGTKEMDIILGTFARKFVPDFTPEQLNEYDSLLCQNDPDLYNWITGTEKAPEEVASMSAFQVLYKSKNDA